MSEFINGLKFTQAKIDEHNLSRTHFFIDFTLENKYGFYITIYHDPAIKPNILHFFKEDYDCPFCNERFPIFSRCQGINDYAETIKNSLLNHPNVRLRKLFL